MQPVLKTVIASVGLAFIASAAHAHAAPEILTQFGVDGRKSHTAGVSVQMTKGVHLIAGARRLEGSEPPAQIDDDYSTIEIEIIERIYWRRFRHLRTQGFYSGIAPQSRRYTHGFYSGR